MARKRANKNNSRPKKGAFDKSKADKFVLPVKAAGSFKIEGALNKRVHVEWRPAAGTAREERQIVVGNIGETDVAGIIRDRRTPVPRQGWTGCVELPAGARTFVVFAAGDLVHWVADMASPAKEDPVSPEPIPRELAVIAARSRGETVSRPGTLSS